MKTKNKIKTILMLIAITLSILFYVVSTTEAIRIIKAEKERDVFIIAQVLSVERSGAYVFNKNEIKNGIAYADYGDDDLKYHLEVGSEVVLILDDGGGKTQQWVIVGWL